MSVQNSGILFIMKEKQINRINPPELFDSASSGFTQVIVEEDENTKTVYVSGQTAWNSDKEMIGMGDLFVQVVESLRNLEKAVKTAELTLMDVHSIRIYIKESHIKDTDAVTLGLKEVFGKNLPCSTWVGVPALAVEDFLVEIEPSPITIFKFKSKGT